VTHFFLQKSCDEKSAERGDCREKRVRSHASRTRFFGSFSARVPPRFAFFSLQQKCLEKDESRCYAGHKIGTFLERYCT
jgi:hypothetical protein